MSGSPPVREFKWEKLGLTFALDSLDRPLWMNAYAQAPSTLILEDRLRIYFSTRPPQDESGQFVSYTGFADFDLEDPTKLIGISPSPVISLGDRGAFDEFGTYPWSAIWHEGKVRAYYGGWTRPKSVPFNVAIGVAESANGGESFSRIGRGGPVLSYSQNEPFVVSGPKIRKFGDIFFLYYIAGKQWIRNGKRLDPIYRIRGATSRDGITWSLMDKDLVSSRIPSEAQASPDVFEFEGRYHMIFCYRYGEDFHSAQRGYRLGYASSEDLINWERNDAVVGLGVSDDGFDSETISYPHFFSAGGQAYLAYLGNNFGRAGFGLARLEAFK